VAGPKRDAWNSECCAFIQRTQVRTAFHAVPDHTEQSLKPEICQDDLCIRTISHINRKSFETKANSVHIRNNCASA
jgi:hypothetical protein